MNNLITPIDDPETREILSNARAAVLSGEISEDQFNDIYNSCYHAYLERLAERTAELGYLTPVHDAPMGSPEGPGRAQR